MQPRDLTDKRFGKLKVKGRVANDGSAKWRCICDCGMTRDIFSTNLINGRSTSCGCSRMKPGDRESPLYKIFVSICTDTVKEWNNWGTFKAWSKRKGYADTMTLEKIDVEAPYGPFNAIYVQS